MPAFCHCGTYIQSWPLKGWEKMAVGRPASTSFNSGWPLPKARCTISSASAPASFGSSAAAAGSLVGDQLAADELHVAQPLRARRQGASGTWPPRPWRRNRAWARPRPGRCRPRGSSPAAAWASPPLRRPPAGGRPTPPAKSIPLAAAQISRKARRFTGSVIARLLVEYDQRSHRKLGKRSHHFWPLAVDGPSTLNLWTVTCAYFWPGRSNVEG